MEHARELCPACSGELTPVPLIGSDMAAVCKVCHGVKLHRDHRTIARNWCHCDDVKPDHQLYFWSPTGHGWFHTLCLQVTQTG